MASRDFHRDLADDIPSLAGPHLNERAIKALMLVVGGMPDVRIKADIRLVPSATCSGAYYMSTADRCTCDDHAYRQVVCKHILAVRLADVITAATAAEQETLPF